MSVCHLQQQPCELPSKHQRAWPAALHASVEWVATAASAPHLVAAPAAVCVAISHADHHLPPFYCCCCCCCRCLLQELQDVLVHVWSGD